MRRLLQGFWLFAIVAGSLPADLNAQEISEQQRLARQAITAGSGAPSVQKDGLPRPELTWANALDAALPSPPDTVVLTRRIATLYAGGLEHYYEYYASALRHRRQMFDWQLASSKIIFFVVIALVLTGVALAVVQFIRDPAGDVSTAEATFAGVKVSSRVLGVILLTLSLVFFYLYLAYVYPIHEAIAVTAK